LDLIGIGTIAVVLIFCGFALGYWSPFQINLAGYATVGWFDWLLIGMVAALFVTRDATMILVAARFPGFLH
jgi:hypothetical protein